MLLLDNINMLSLELFHLMYKTKLIFFLKNETQKANVITVTVTNLQLQCVLNKSNLPVFIYLFF